MGHVSPKEARNKNIIAAPFKYLQIPARLSWGRQRGILWKGVPEHKPRLGQAWDAVELTEYSFLLRV